MNEILRSSSVRLDEVKSIVKQLQGKNIAMIVNKGRNKLVKLNATIEKVYPSMFIIKPEDASELDRTSFSYSDILCGDIQFLFDKDAQM